MSRTSNERTTLFEECMFTYPAQCAPHPTRNNVEGLLQQELQKHWQQGSGECECTFVMIN